MSCQIANNPFEVVITPSRKRKRGSERYDMAMATSPASPQFHSKTSAATAGVRSAAAQAELPCNGVINAAFSSTPKKQAKSLIESFQKFSHKSTVNKENNPFPVNSCLEVKSIADIANKKQSFEVVRKPPKKKKRADIEVACFENPALNLDGPEKQFNPFEVIRSPAVKSWKEGFSNPCLNIKTQETSLAQNPFEIKRLQAHSNHGREGFENPAMEQLPAGLTIGIPFTPRVGCRIDFKNFPLDNLTPTKILAEKLVFSPMIASTALKTPKPQMLSIISEEAIDIGKELDCYQLELENSINEAKLRKGPLLGAKQSSFGKRLEEIEESDSEESTPADMDLGVKEIRSEEVEPTTPVAAAVEEIIEPKKEETELIIKEEEQKIESNNEKNNQPVEKGEEEPVEKEHEDESFYDDDEEENDFKAPAPFVRAYRRPDPLPKSTHTSKESLASNSSNKSKEADSNKVTNMIRKSIRKLLPSSKKDNNDPAPPPQPAQNNIFSSIRHSLRRRPNKQAADEKDKPEEEDNTREMSIMDCAERPKFKANVIQTDYLKIEEIEPMKKSSLRSSIRKSTRGVKNHVMKSVFHKNVEQYQLQK